MRDTLYVSIPIGDTPRHRTAARTATLHAHRTYTGVKYPSSRSLPTYGASHQKRFLVFGIYRVRAEFLSTLPAWPHFFGRRPALHCGFSLYSNGSGPPGSSASSAASCTLHRMALYGILGHLIVPSHRLASQMALQLRPLAAF